MNFETLKQNTLYIVTAILVFAILYAVKPSILFQPKGLVLPASNASAKLLPNVSSKPVRLYSHAPFDYTSIGAVRVQGHTLHPTKEQQRRIVQYAQSLAKKAGATGLIIKTLAFEPPSSSTPKPLAKLVFFGEAIKTANS